MTCDQFDVVVVPFPFSDLPRSKKRKALVISTKKFNHTNGNSILLMITSAKKSEWLFDVKILDLKHAGLNKNCVVRMKSFTLDNGLLLEVCGHLGAKDSAQVIDGFKKSCALV
jgi:mRNA interferase MazF